MGGDKLPKKAKKGGEGENANGGFPETFAGPAGPAGPSLPKKAKDKKAKDKKKKKKAKKSSSSSSSSSGSSALVPGQAPNVSSQSDDEAWSPIDTDAILAHPVSSVVEEPSPSPTRIARNDSSEAAQALAKFYTRGAEADVAADPKEKLWSQHGWVGWFAETEEENAAEDPPGKGLPMPSSSARCDVIPTAAKSVPPVRH